MSLEYATEDNGWVNTVDSNSPEVIEKVRRIIANNIYCTLSTCSTDGYPWASPVLFVYDERWNVYWSSAIASRHSQNIYQNGRVAIAIFDSSIESGVEGLYLTGTATELGTEQVAEVIKLLTSRTRRSLQRLPEDYLDDSPRRMYQFCPQEVWVTGERVAFGDGRLLVDTRVQVNLLDLSR